MKILMFEEIKLRGTVIFEGSWKLYFNDTLVFVENKLLINIKWFAIMVSVT